MLFFPYFTDASHHLVTFNFFFILIFFIWQYHSHVFSSQLPHTLNIHSRISLLFDFAIVSHPQAQGREIQHQSYLLLFFFSTCSWFIDCFHFLVPDLSLLCTTWSYFVLQRRKKKWRWYLRHGFLIVWIGYQISKIKGMLFLI